MPHSLHFLRGNRGEKRLVLKAPKVGNLRYDVQLTVLALQERQPMALGGCAEKILRKVARPGSATSTPQASEYLRAVNREYEAQRLTRRDTKMRSCV